MQIHSNTVNHIREYSDTGDCIHSPTIAVKAMKDIASYAKTANAAQRSTCNCLQNQFNYSHKMRHSLWQMTRNSNNLQDLCKNATKTSRCSNRSNRCLFIVGGSRSPRSVRSDPFRVPPVRPINGKHWRRPVRSNQNCRPSGRSTGSYTFNYL